MVVIKTEHLRGNRNATGFAILLQIGNHNVVGAYAHANLLGWVTSALFGTYYALNKEKAAQRLAMSQFGVSRLASWSWCHQAAAPFAKMLAAGLSACAAPSKAAPVGQRLADLKLPF